MPAITHLNTLIKLKYLASPSTIYCIDFTSRHENKCASRSCKNKEISVANINITQQYSDAMFTRHPYFCALLVTSKYVVISSPLLSPMMVVGAQGAGWQLHTDVPQSQTARYQTLDRGLRPGPELFWETKNGSEITTQENTSALDTGLAQKNTRLITQMQHQDLHHTASQEYISCLSGCLREIFVYKYF